MQTEAQEPLKASDCFSEATNTDTVIRGVLLCGNSSKNGYDIPADAFVGEDHAKGLYTSKAIFLDHPGPDGKRSVRDLSGVILETYYRNGKPYGDIETKDYPGGPTLLALTRVKGAPIGMSHVARYEWADRSRKRVKRISEVASVDVVVNPATTRSFYEHDKGLTMDELTNELKTVRQERDDAQESVKTLQARVTELEGQAKTASDKAKADGERITSLETESKGLKAKIDEFETKEAIAARRNSVLESLKAEGLNPEDKAQVSEVFMESLLDTADETRRKALIGDRAKVVKESAKNGTAGPAERKTPGNKVLSYSERMAKLKGETK